MYREDNLVFVDVETTGLDPLRHEIIEVAIISKSFVYCTKIKPSSKSIIDPQAIAINGYNKTEWRNAPTAAAIAPKIGKLLNNKTIVAHNPIFDVSFIDELLFKHEEPARFNRRLIDTTVLAHEHLLMCGLKSLSLDSIRQFFNWSLEGNHRAPKDAEDCMKLYYKLSRATFIDRLYWKYKRKFLIWFGFIK